MQATKPRTETQAVTLAQSVEAVQTLIQAGLGCITFLRDLLPEENFTPTSFATFDDSFALSTDGSTPTPQTKQGGGSFRIMTMTRGCTEEADRLLNYLEGIFDALQKQYLKSFIFAIYLDQDKPNNVYCKIPGTDVSVPIMTLDETMNNASVGGRDQSLKTALKQGRVPTLKDVKRSVKSLLKQVITSAQQMDCLPKKRFANFKVLYTDLTPADYEPPGFKPGDVDKDRWYITTHDMNEIPERFTMGKLDTGHHRVKLSVASIASYLPASTQHDNEPFAGTTNPKDAALRNVVWAVDTADAVDPDAEGEVDEEYVSAGGISRLKSFNDSGIDIQMLPVGVRNAQGIIEPIPPVELVAHFSGVTQDAPLRLEDMNVEEAVNGELSGTQPMMTPTQTHQHTAATDMKLDINGDTMPADDDEILGDTRGALEEVRPVVDNGLKCECGVDVDDNPSVHCDGKCGHWFHTWCMGYHSEKDKRLPDEFICFGCRARADEFWELAKTSLYPKAHANLHALALFRRAIKTAEFEGPGTPGTFGKLMHCDVALGKQLFKRLEDEQVIEVDSMGVQHSRSAALKGKGKAAAKNRKTLGKSRWVFNHSMKDSQAYKDYFNPDTRVEGKLLKIPELEKEMKAAQKAPFRDGTNRTPRDSQVVEDSQTQEDTQMLDGTRKRDGDNQVSERPKKRTKISVAFAVDLAE
ncbi:HORMA domain-containing protein [Schizophyllum amplum]|uniref:HORMA domain-containing protein n=1 Tax=Schizophyllum amplum TaxID=97359 RepID=A0A550C199_9AGAR|nr:HORMA domain-containing protein [Auriculariopsis ampla]